MASETEQEQLLALQAENARLISLLEAQGIDWRVRPTPADSVIGLEPSKFSTEEKLALFRRLFRGRLDSFPVRWESKVSGRSGYAPACANEWRPSVCEKPRIKCSDCSHRLFIPVSDQVIFDHLAGKHTVGIYPMPADETCYLVAVVV